MSNKNTARSIEELKRAAKAADVQTFVGVFTPLVMLDAPKWLGIMRVQRLVEAFRSAVAIRQLRGALSNACADVHVEKSVCVEVMHHIDVCEFMQEVYTTIDEQTVLAWPSNSSREALFRAVVRMVRSRTGRFKAALSNNSLADLCHRQRRNNLRVGNVRLGMRWMWQ